MPFYLAEYIGSGTRADPFRPVGFDQPGAAAIDLRPDGGATLDGAGLNACLLRTADPFTDARARFLADDKLESLTNQQKNFLTNKLGVDLSSPTLLRDIIATIMTAPPANGWKPLRPGPLRWEIWLGELIWEAPYISGGATDDFNRANAVLSAPWTAVGASTLSVVSNAVKNVGAGADNVMYYAGAATGADQYCQVKTIATVIGDVGPTVRAQDVGGSVYGYVLAMAVTNPALAKFVTGSFTSLNGGMADYNTQMFPGDTAGIRAVGTTLTAYKVGYGDFVSTNNNVTDTSIPGTGGTGAGQPGLFFFDNTTSLDDWKGGDYAPTTVTFDISPTSNDGGGYRKGSTWAGVPAAAYNATDGSPISLIKSLFAAEYYVGCTYFRFDTSSLPDGATVTAAALKLYVSDKGDPDNVDYAADSYDFTSQPSDASDWEYSSSGNAIATIDATSVTTGVVNSFPITTLGVISLTGFTTLRLAPKNTTTPTGDNFIEVSLSEDATPARRPQLEVTYTASATEKQSFYAARRRRVGR